MLKYKFITSIIVGDRAHCTELPNTVFASHTATQQIKG